MHRNKYCRLMLARKTPVFALALLGGLGISGAVQATPLFPYYAVPQYRGTADVSTESSLVPGTYLHSAAGVRYIDVPLGSSTPSGFSPAPTTDTISLLNHETQAEALYGAGAGTLHAVAAAAFAGLGSNLPPSAGLHGAAAQAIAGYSDYVLVQGPVGASGFAILRFALHLEGSIFAGLGAPGASDRYGVGAFEGADIYVPSNQAGISCLPTCFASIASATGDSVNGHYNFVYSNSDTFTVLAAYGTLLEMGGNLNVSASGWGYATEGGSATALYRDTMYTYIDVLTPGVSLLTSSGHDYSSPVSGGGGGNGTGNGNGNTVPEPASLSLLGIGLVGLGITRRRKQSVNPSDYLAAVSY